MYYILIFWYWNFLEISLLKYNNNNNNLYVFVLSNWFFEVKLLGNCFVLYDCWWVFFWCNNKVWVDGFIYNIKIEIDFYFCNVDIDFNNY